MAGNGALSFKVMDWDRLTKDDIVGVCAISPEKLVEVSAMPPGETMVQHLRILTRGGVPTLGKDKQPTRLEVHLRVEEIEHGAQVLQGDPEEQHSAPVAVDTSLHVRVTTGYHLPLDLCGRCHLPPEEDSLGREVHLSLGLGGEEQSSAVRGGQAGGGEIRGWGENVRWMQDFRFEQEEDMAAPSGDEALTSAGRRKLREQRADPGLVFTVFDKGFGGMGGGDTRLGSVAVARNLLPSFDEHGVGKRLDSVGLLLDKHGYAIYAEGSKFPATLGYSLWIGITAAREALAPLQLTRPLTILEPLLETGNLYSGAKVVLRVAYEDPRNGEHHGQHHAGAVARGHSHTAPDFARYVDAPVWRGGNGEVLVGRDVVPWVGMRVVMARQALRWRHEQAWFEGDPSLGQAGVVVRIMAGKLTVQPAAYTRVANAATCKVRWEATGKFAYHNAGLQETYDLCPEPEGGTAKRSYRNDFAVVIPIPEAIVATKMVQ
ncbi:hypothetical protein T484DRAFT_1827494 [Baffinella frigidus]|nr:hypothetical protein T484DRAFT_1827494 [Cryptophyta sp. CCMP2293]